MSDGITEAQNVILCQLAGDCSDRAVSWETLSGRQQLEWLRGENPNRASSENHPMFPAASQALAGDGDAQDFWNLLADKEMMGIELGVATVYSTWHWTLWAIAAEGFQRHGWDQSKLDRVLERFAVLSALSAVPTDDKYDGGELASMTGVFCRGPWLCLPWGKRGFSRTGENRTGPATHLWQNFQGWMLAQACGLQPVFEKDIWEKKCLTEIGQWSRLSSETIDDIKPWVDGGDTSALDRLLERLSGMATLGPEVIFERTFKGLAVWAPISAAVGAQGTQPTQGATYAARTVRLYPMTPGDGKRNGVPESTATEEVPQEPNADHLLRRGGGAPTSASLPGMPDTSIPMPGGTVVRRVVISQQNL